MILVLKRDGTEEEFNIKKLKKSLAKVIIASESDRYDLPGVISTTILDNLSELEIDKISTDDIREIACNFLKSDGAIEELYEYNKEYESRNLFRNKNSNLMKLFSKITLVKDSDMQKENANINSNTAMGTMLKYGSESAKEFNLTNLVSPKIAKAHIDGDIHIHDLDFLSLTETCCHIPLDRLFKNGFNTGHGYLREPGGIRAAGALAAIAIQSNQNDQHKSAYL